MKSETQNRKEGSCRCPYCDEEIARTSPLCKVCGVPISYCASCQAPLKKGANVCQVCGTKV